MASFTTVAAFLKQHYYGNERSIPDLTYPESFTYAVIPKDESWGGSSGEFPLIYGHNQSVSADFDTAQANLGAVDAVRWSIPPSGRKTRYGFAQFPTDVIRAMESKENAYRKLIPAEVDSIMKSMARRIAIDLHGNGYGAIGQVSNTSFSTTEMTLVNPEDARKFENKMWLQFSDSDHGDALRDSGDRLQVVGIDEDSGTITLSGNLSGISGIAENDYIFPQGDRHDSATPSRRQVVGLETLNPYDRSLVGTLFGVDRTLHKTRLGGSYLDGSNMSLHEAIMTLASKMADRGGDPKYIVMSYANWTELAKELGSQKEYSDVEVANVGFSGIRFRGPKRRPLECVADNACPSNRVRLFNPETLKLLAVGKPIGFLDEDDIGPILRVANADAYQTRVGGYIELMSEKPIDLGVISTDGA